LSVERGRMRNLCPVCDSETSDSFILEFAVPDGWPCPEVNEVKLCSECGFIWYDNDMSQANYDEYYQKYYGYHLNNAYNRTRLWNIAQFIQSIMNTNAQIVDFGGDDGYLADHLIEIGFKNVKVHNIGDQFANKPDLIVASQVIEHIYDIHPVIDSFYQALSSNGMCLVELPEAQLFSKRDWPPLLDYNQKHINHFNVFNLDLLFAKHQFSNVNRDFIEYKPLNSPCYRALYQKDGHKSIFQDVKFHIQENDFRYLSKLKEIDQPVIVFGIGDIAMHLLQKSSLDVVYFIDNDPIYSGQILMGKPIKNVIDSDEPILVMAQGQKDSILEDLKKRGVKNEVIVL